MALISKAEQIIMDLLDEEIDFIIATEEEQTRLYRESFTEGIKAGLLKARYLIGEKAKYIFTKENLLPETSEAK